MPDITQSCGATISQEIEGLFLSMSSLLEDSFSQLRSRLDKVEANLLGAITETKTKDEMIASLSKKVEELQVQVNTKD